jgi:hypothetical protein
MVFTSVMSYFFLQQIVQLLLGHLVFWMRCQRDFSKKAVFQLVALVAFSRRRWKSRIWDEL